MKEKTNVFVY